MGRACSLKCEDRDPIHVFEHKVKTADKGWLMHPDNFETFKQVVEEGGFEAVGFDYKYFGPLRLIPFPDRFPYTPRKRWWVQK